MQDCPSGWRQGGASCEVVEQYGCVFKAGVATHCCKLSMWDWMSLLTQLCGSILKGMRIPRASRVEGVFATKHVPLGISRGSVGKGGLCVENPQGRGVFGSCVPLGLHSVYHVVCVGPVALAAGRFWTFLGEAPLAPCMVW